MSQGGAVDLLRKSELLRAQKVEVGIASGPRIELPTNISTVEPDKTLESNYIP
jgi:hypothetical protein